MNYKCSLNAVFNILIELLVMINSQNDEKKNTFIYHENK